MRKSYLPAAALASALGLAGFLTAIGPAAADSEGGSAACAQTADPGTLTLNLDAIPVQPVAGKLSVRGVAGDDDEDCGPQRGEDAERGKYGEDD